MTDATQRRASKNLVGGPGEANNVKSLIATIALAASASGTQIVFGRIPSNARILPQSKIYNDDLATSGSPTLDIGLKAVDSNITTDPDALNNGLALSSAGSNEIFADHANAGLPAWDNVSGQSTDPKGELDVIGTVKDAATNAAGDVTISLLYTVD